MKISDHLVSVIIPAYNVEYCIEQAVNSVLGQTHKNLELIVVDDGSTDNTYQVIKKNLSTAKIEFTLISTDNKGSCAAKNLALEKAKGEFVAFLDADDLWEPGKLEHQVKCISRDSHSIGVGCSYIKFLDNTNKKTNIINFSWNKETIFKWMILEEEGPGLNSTIMLRTSVLREIGGFDESLGSMADDLELTWRLHLVGNIIELNHCLAKIRVWGGQIHRDRVDMEKALHKVYKKHFKEGTRELKLAMGNLYVWIGLKNIMKFRFILGLKSILSGIKLSPGRAILLPLRLVTKSTKLV
jgi:glycosyltransferase involved in cell wall biosynthesis